VGIHAPMGRYSEARPPSAAELFRIAPGAHETRTAGHDQARITNCRA
jgi:hypothetical protein